MADGTVKKIIEIEKVVYNNTEDKIKEI